MNYIYNKNDYTAIAVLTDDDIERKIPMTVIEDDDVYDILEIQGISNQVLVIPEWLDKLYTGKNIEYYKCGIPLNLSRDAQLFGWNYKNVINIKHNSINCVKDFENFATIVTRELCKKDLDYLKKRLEWDSKTIKYVEDCINNTDFNSSVINGIAQLEIEEKIINPNKSLLYDTLNKLSYSDFKILVLNLYEKERDNMISKYYIDKVIMDLPIRIKMSVRENFG